MRQPHVVVILSGVTLSIAIGYAVLAVWQHTRFLTHGHDLGLFSQVLWELGRLQAPATTVRQFPLPNIFGDHFDPIYLLLVPVYRIVDSPLVLVVAQALLLAAVVPLGFLVARAVGLPRGAAVVLAVALGLHPGFTAAVRFDFHPIAFAPALLLAVVLLAERGRWRWYWLALAGLLITKESMPLYAALLGVTLVLRRRWTIGLATVVAALGYFVVVTSLVMPALAGQPYGYWRLYPELGESPRQAIEHVARHPLASLALLVSTQEKRHTIAVMFGSFAYLPVLSWTMWPILFMTLAERFWSAAVPLWLFRFHFQVVMTTVLFVATLYVLHDLGARLGRLRGSAPGIALLVLLATAWAAGASGVWEQAFTSAPPATLETWRAALRQIPPAARVSAQDAFVPHLSHRPAIYQFPRVRDAEYVVIDPRAPAWPATPDEVRAAQERLPRLGWRLLWRGDTTTVFQRVPGSRTPPVVSGWE